MDHSWIDHQVVDEEIFIEYREGVEYFYDFIFENMVLLYQRWACCPCNICGNREIFDRDTITIYLYKNAQLQALIPVRRDVGESCKG